LKAFSTEDNIKILFYLTVGKCNASIT